MDRRLNSTGTRNWCCPAAAASGFRCGGEPWRRRAPAAGGLSHADPHADGRDRGARHPLLCFGPGDGDGDFGRGGPGPDAASGGRKFGKCVAGAWGGGLARRGEAHGNRAAATGAARWRQTFEQPPAAIWQGEWVRADGVSPGRLRNVSDFSYRRADGTPVAAYTVNARDNSGSIASVSPQSRLRVRFRIRGGHGVLLLVGLHGPMGGWVGNFQTIIEPTRGRGQLRLADLGGAALGVRGKVPHWHRFRAAGACSWST